MEAEGGMVLWEYGVLSGGVVYRNIPRVGESPMSLQVYIGDEGVGYSPHGDYDLGVTLLNLSVEVGFSTGSNDLSVFGIVGIQLAIAGG